MRCEDCKTENATLSGACEGCWNKRVYEHTNEDKVPLSARMFGVTIWGIWIAGSKAPRFLHLTHKEASDQAKNIGGHVRPIDVATMRWEIKP